MLSFRHKHDETDMMVDTKGNTISLRQDGHAEAEAIGISAEHEAFEVENRDNQMQYQELQDELADELSNYREDVTLASTDVVPRRKRRMIVDIDDD